MNAKKSLLLRRDVAEGASALDGPRPKPEGRRRVLWYHGRQLVGLHFAALITAVALWDGSVQAGEPAQNPQAVCQNREDELRQQALHEMHQLQIHLARIYWSSRASWEVRYQSEWEAIQKKSDSISDARSAQGEVEAGRFRAQADRLWEESLQSRTAVKTQIGAFQGMLESLPGCCPAWVFTQCRHLWSEKTLEDLQTFKAIFQKAEIFWDAFNEKIQQTVQEDPSDHTPYGPRMSEPLQKWTEKLEPELLLAVRSLEYDFESALIQEDCCLRCTDENLKRDRQKQAHPFPQAGRSTIGVGGNILPQKNLGPSLVTLQEEVRFKTATEKESSD